MDVSESSRLTRTFRFGTKTTATLLMISNTVYAAVVEPVVQVEIYRIEEYTNNYAGLKR